MDGTTCTGGINGSSPCTPEKPSELCGGHWDDWQCMNLKQYCVGGHAFTCGAWWRAGRGGVKGRGAAAAAGWQRAGSREAAGQRSRE